MRVTLTFDNGPTPGITEEVLDKLAARQLHAWFFLVGDRLAVPGARALAERTKAEGHRIGNHSMTHTVPLGLLPDAAASVAEITDAAAVFGDLVEPDRTFRPFGRGGRIGRHLLSPAAVDHLNARRYSVALWSSVPRDWTDQGGWVETALAQMKGNPWPVVVMHDTPDACLAKLDNFLDELERLDADVTLDFPDDCLPIRHGVATTDLAPLTSAGTVAIQHSST